MSMFKKVLAGTTAIAGLIALAAPANASVTGGTATDYIASATATPAAATSFTSSTGVVTVSSAASGTFTAGVATALFTTGNTITFTLSQGTFANLPTATPTGGTITYISGGAGQNFVTYQFGGTNTVVALSNVNVAGVTTVTDTSLIRVTVSDGAGALNGVAAADKRVTLANFLDAYDITFTPATPSVDLGATNPGAQYDDEVLGSITITPLGSNVAQWGAPGTNAALGATKGSVALTLPAGLFTSATLKTGCVAADQTVTTIASNVVTFTGLGAVDTPAGVACTSNVEVDNPAATSTTLLATGATSAAVTLNLANAPTSAGSTVTATDALGTITFANGAPTTAAYTVGADAAYDFYVNVANGATAGPVIVSASTAGSTGTAVLNSSLAANTNAIYSITDIKTALIAAGMPSTIFASGGDRGQLTIVVPTGGKTTPLLLNKANGQVVEVSRQ